MSEERQSTIEATVHHIQEELSAFRAEVATEFSVVRTDMATEFRAVRAEMATEFSAVRTEMATEFRAVRTEMATEFRAVRTEMATATELTGVRGEIQDLRHEMRLMFEDIRSDIKALPDHREYIDHKMANGLASIRDEFEPRLRNVELALEKRPRRR
jgi:hypothetical protein